MRFSTAIRQPVRRRIERMGQADVLIGVPCFNNDMTIGQVVRTVEEGLAINFSNMRCVVMVADGGSVDDSREEAEDLEARPWIERVVSIYRGIPGKGSAVRAIFEAANMLEVRACVLFDSDLRSITPEWTARMVHAILEDGYDFVVPYYKRYKYDGTITNNIVYNLTRALYGCRVRQPIGGDFALSLPLITKLIKQDVWESDVARFGIDVWLTTTAIVEKIRIAQVNLGVKIHDVKDPGESLGPMFRQVVFTLFSLMEQHEARWKSVTGSEPVPIVGPPSDVEPLPFSINVERLVRDFRIGFNNYKELWAKIVSDADFKIIEELNGIEVDAFLFPVDSWCRILFDLAVTYHRWEGDKELLVSLMTPLYFARIASFVNRTLEMSTDEAEEVVEEQAMVFEEMKPYLLDRWEAQE